MVKNFRAALAALALAVFIAPAIAQPGPGGPGPVPPPSPWLYAAPSIYAPAGSCITLPQTVPGGCPGGGNAVNAQALFVSGNPVVASGAVAPVGGLPLYAAPAATGTGSCLSAGNACTLATACSFRNQIATFLGAASPINLLDAHLYRCGKSAASALHNCGKFRRQFITFSDPIGQLADAD